jgi:hypothetical protein
MRPRIALVAATALLASACELQESTIAEAEPFVVVEAFLEVGSNDVRVALHGSAGAEELADAGAIVDLIGADSEIRLVRVNPLQCMAFGYGIDPQNFPGGLACYRTPLAYVIQPDALYQLSVVLADGRRLDGATRTPDVVELTSVTGESDEAPCFLEPWTQLELTWNSVEGAAAYILDLRATGIREALEQEGIEADVADPLILRGVAIGDQDTTIVLPSEFGVFDRFNLDPQLNLALQRGVPPGVEIEMVVAAVDQNFVDWVRGGDFNPSGLIRSPSLFGDAGTGVIASMSTDALYATTYDSPPQPAPCQ